MQKKSTLLSLFLLAFISGFSQNASNFWIDISPQSYELLGSYRGIPTHYRAMSLDEVALKKILKETPHENRGLQNGKTLLFPHPNGEVKRYKIVESPIMEEGLARRFSEIKTYLGKGIDDPRTTIRFSMTPQGFHGIIHQPGGTIYIDPYPAVNQQVYFSYYKKDYQAAKSFAEANLPGDPGGGDIGPLAPAGSGQALKTYRIAIATTGEYAAFHGGTTSSVMSAIATTLNRVNSIYEKELALRFILVNNNDQIIYLDANSDPFTNNDAGLLINENQATIDAQIGTANYDIGHVFSTGGGGLASTGVCQNGAKAYGVTGTSRPIGDPFDVDYVAHEIGHQFSAQHTFNSRQGGCQGNRVSSSAFEPGSGSTILGYAGLCAFDNLQANSNDYFHFRSYSQILTYITNQAGSTCGTSIPTGNTPPTASVVGGNKPIPIMTPFELEGTGTDVDGDSLTYCWEQYDLGPSGSPNSPAGDAPIFRSLPPATSPIRVFPRLESIINDTSTLGEILPTYSRNLNFRFTVRDNNPTGGGVEFASTQFSATSLAGPFELIFPNMSTTIWIRAANVKVPIRWNTANTELAPVNCDSVEISLSVDGGYTYPFTLAESVPNTGMASVVFPNINTDSARVKVKAKENVFFTISEEDFSIKLDNVGLDQSVPGLSIDVGPNPVLDILGLHFESTMPVSIAWDLIDLKGRVLDRVDRRFVVQNKEIQQVDMGEYPSGMYLLRIRTKDQLIIRKVLRQ